MDKKEELINKKEEFKSKTCIACFSGGKDSVATIILAHLRGWPLHKIVFSEVMFDKETSGELPEHIDFVKNTAIPLFESWGYECVIVHSEKTYMDCFNHVIKGSSVPERNGKRRGFPMGGKCNINRDCKTKPITQYMKSIEGEIVQYIGIAKDEPERMERLKGTNKFSILDAEDYTEQMAYELAAEYNLLSPHYGFAPRGGCWFCPNARYGEKKHLRTHHRELWQKLLDLENEDGLVGAVWDTRNKRSAHQDEEMFMWEDRQIKIWDFLEE